MIIIYYRNEAGKITNAHIAPKERNVDELSVRAEAFNK